MPISLVKIKKYFPLYEVQRVKVCGIGKTKWMQSNNINHLVNSAIRQNLLVEGLRYTDHL